MTSVSDSTEGRNIDIVSEVKTQVIETALKFTVCSVFFTWCRRAVSLLLQPGNWFFICLKASVHWMGCKLRHRHIMQRWFIAKPGADTCHSLNFMAEPRALRVCTVQWSLAQLSRRRPKWLPPVVTRKQRRPVTWFFGCSEISNAGIWNSGSSSSKTGSIWLSSNRSSRPLL